MTIERPVACVADGRPSPSSPASRVRGNVRGLPVAKWLEIDSTWQQRGNPKVCRQSQPWAKRLKKTPQSCRLDKTAPITRSHCRHGAGGGNRTRDSCLEGKGITIMQRPRNRHRWWAGQDSNLRSAFARRIYSPMPLTTRPPTHDGDRKGYAPRPAGPAVQHAPGRSSPARLRIATQASQRGPAATAPVL